MNERQLRYALAVRNERNFSRAAASLNVSQPSVSDQIRLLEDELGFSLFRRTGRGIELTQAGRSFLQEADRTMDHFASLADHAIQLRRGSEARFAIGLSSGVARYFTPSIMKRLKPLLSNIQLEVVTASGPQIQRLIQDRELDAGLLAEIGPMRLPQGLQRENLTRVEMSVFAPPDHRVARAGKSLELADLVDEPLIMNEPSVGYGALVQSMFQQQGLTPNVVALAGSVNTTTTMIRSNVGLAILPAVCAEMELRLGELVRLPLKPRREVFVVLLRPTVRLRPQAEECVAAVIEAVRTIHANALSGLS